ncbi:hypothetical protein ACN47E_000738 [Coniothyrium glycines]
MEAIDLLSPLRSPAALPLPTHITEILLNWDITSVEAIVPQDVHASIDPTCLSDPLFLALHELSCLTVGQRDRAHSLMNTYFQCRIRESSYSGKQSRLYAGLEVSDVEQAITSVRKMTKGLKLENKDSEDASGKRKYSIRQEIIPSEEDEDDEPPTKLAKLNTQNNTIVKNETPDMSPLFSLAALSPLLPLPSPAALLTPRPTPSRSKRPIRLPPLNTSIPNISPSVPPSSAKSLHPPPITAPTLYNNYPRPSFQIPIPKIPDFHSSPPYMAQPTLLVHPAVQAAQRATHDFNVRRLELADAERWYTEARKRCVDAKRRMDGAAHRARAYR